MCLPMTTFNQSERPLFFHQPTTPMPRSHDQSGAPSSVHVAFSRIAHSAASIKSQPQPVSLCSHLIPSPFTNERQLKNQSLPASPILIVLFRSHFISSHL